MANGISPTAQSALDALFASYGSPLPILSGYRDPETNARVGGARGSQHLHGNAFDVDVSGLSQAERINLANMARSAGFQGFGFYDNSMHFDVGAPRAWGPDYSSGSIPSWARDWTSQNLGGGAAPLAATMSTRGTGMNGMDQQRPSGLLEFMGIQQRDPSAEGETAMPFYQRPRFADFMGALAVGLNELRQRPSEAIPQIVAAGQERRRDDRQRNATTEWLMSQPGGQSYVQLINSGAAPSQAVGAYINAQRSDRQAAQNANVQSVQQLPDGGAVYYMRDGQIVVRSVAGETLEGEAAQQYVREAQSYGADLQSQIYGSRRSGTLEAEIELGGAAAGASASGTEMVNRAFQAFDQLQNVNSSISTIDQAIAAIDAGAQSGMIYNMLPDVTQASASLRNAMNRMGLDVISSITFGALSEAEMNLAMETAVPRNLAPAELRAWLEERRSVQVKAAEALRNAANYFSTSGNTLQGWLDQQGGQQAPAAAPSRNYDAEGNRIP